MQKPYLLLALLLCLNSCSKEEFSSNNDELLKDTTSPPILNDFSLEHFGDPFIKNNLVVNWGQKSTINEENEEYPTNINSKLHNAKEFIYHKYILNVKPAEKGNNRFEIVRLISSQDVENVSLVNLQARKFTGTIISYDLLGNIIKTEVYIEGSKPENIQNYEINTMKYIPKNDCSAGCWVMMWEERWTDFYNASSPNISEWFYTSSRYDGQRSYYVWQSGNDYTIPPSTSTNPYHSHTDYPHGPNVGSNNHPREILLGPTVTPCVTDIIKKLEEKDTHYSVIPDLSGIGASHLTQQILSIFNNSAEFGLKIDVEQLGTNSAGHEINGRTLKYSNGWSITLDIDLTKNGTQLFIAKTIIHEAVHAFISKTLRTNRTSELSIDLNTIYQKFKNEDSSFNLTQHEFMSEYVEAFALSLASWDNHRQAPEYYKMLSWGGLESSTLYQSLNNKTEIQNAIYNERYNKTGAKSYPCP